MRPTLVRAVAIGIAMLAVLDPALTSARPARPLVALVSGEGGLALERRAVDVLQSRFAVVRGSSDAASATVLLGAIVPDEFRTGGAPVFAVLPAMRRPGFRISRIDTPSPLLLNERIRIEVQVPTAAAAGRELNIELSMDGLAIGQANAPVRTDSSLVAVAFDAAPSSGAHALRAIARMSGDAAADTATTVVDVRDERLRVLFFDPRPSWASTFVRRVLEGDARFSVAHRVVTSRGLSNTAGAAPSTLRAPESLERFAAVVVAAPDQLSEADVDGLEAFMRRRGGRVVLLMEGRSTPALDRLSGASGWRSVQLAAPAAVVDLTNVTVLRGRELSWPATLSPDASVHAINLGPDSAQRPIVWSVPVGAGRLIVSGAMDAWHQRGESTGFDAFWSSTLALHAALAPAPVDARVAPQLVAPGDEAGVRIAIRDAMLDDKAVRSAKVNATLVSDVDSTPIGLWPERSAGVFSARVVAPRRPGTYRLAVTSGTERATVPIIVDTLAHRHGVAEPDVVRAFVSSRGGSVVEEQHLERLPTLIASAVQSVSRVETWHPMRSAWWIVPFALLLGAEWWWRRRRGLA